MAWVGAVAAVATVVAAVGAVGVFVVSGVVVAIDALNNGTPKHYRFMRHGRNPINQVHTSYALSKARCLLRRTQRAHPNIFDHVPGTELLFHIHKQDATTVAFPKWTFKRLQMNQVLHIAQNTNPIVIELEIV